MLQICSLGSSYAAGPGIPPLVGQADAMRSGYNYAHLIAQQLEAQLTDLTSSGSTLLNIITEPQTFLFYNDTFPPQITGIPEDADIITLTAGGNDLNYIVDYSWIVGTRLGQKKTSSNAQESSSLSLEEIGDRLGAVLDEIHKRAPEARIYLVEYPAVLCPDTRPGLDIPLNQDKMAHHSQVASKLQKAYSLAAGPRSEWCERVPVHERSLSHALGSPGPWLDGLGLLSLIRRGPVLHPHPKGMKAVAEMLLAPIQKHPVLQ
ncbi:hypothetical protein AbraIFM66951_007990 [Aspergillus brasiliensis]|uniref:SGNH hydrolase-type esterase domain-containing protein n=1 Tax=Aspergillus brasiliensis TaxID=319629 RepID=A0A9W6DPJ2_9EURO|nr:hypothetical protein AbraCBS73388_008496 [Aspergillus brasiliensis]GKZ45373.1 hypothetical protein AbraIFM66951_007990 [Aspergillus brasiliensis]